MRQQAEWDTIKNGDSIYLSSNYNAIKFLIKTINNCQERPFCDAKRCLNKNMILVTSTGEYQICMNKDLLLYKDMEDLIINKVTEI